MNKLLKDNSKPVDTAKLIKRIYVMCGITLAFVVTTFSILLFLLYSLITGNASNEDNNASAQVQTETNEEVREDGSTLTNYNTGITEWKFTLDGKELTFNTPKDFYSLSDQYAENLSEYYGVDDLDIGSLAVIGDAPAVYNSNTMINADTISNVKNLLSQVNDDSYNVEDFQMSEAYTYMTTGSLPEELPMNYKLEEVGSYTIDGVNFKAYDVSFDTEYVDESVSTNDVTTVHTQQLVCYSDTSDDILEVIIYQSEYNKDKALDYLKDFLGVKEK